MQVVPGIGEVMAGVERLGCEAGRQAFLALHSAPHSGRV